MLNRHSRTAAGLALALATGLVALPACDKKKPSDGGPPNSGYQGSKGGPPPGMAPKQGGPNGKTGDQTEVDKGHKTGSKSDDHTGGKTGGKADEHAGGKTGDQQTAAGVPAPPTKGPQLQSSDGKSREQTKTNLTKIGLAFHKYTTRCSTFRPASPIARARRA